MQGNFKYPRIKKIHQILEKIRFYQKIKIFVSCYHMNCCLQKYTTHQFTYFFIIYFNTKSKIQKLSKPNKYIKSYQQNMIEFLEKLFLFELHLNLK